MTTNHTDESAAVQRVARFLSDFHGEVNDSQVLPPEYYESDARDLLDALGLRRIGVATEAGIASGSDFVVTPRESPGDVPLYRLVRDTEADRG